MPRGAVVDRYHAVLRANVDLRRAIPHVAAAASSRSQPTRPTACRQTDATKPCQTLEETKVEAMAEATAEEEMEEEKAAAEKAVERVRAAMAEAKAEEMAAAMAAAMAGCEDHKGCQYTNGRSRSDLSCCKHAA